LFSLLTEICSMAKRAIERGQRYRDARSSVLSGSGTEWIVEEVFRGTDGVQYARLACASDLTLRKTLAVAVLSDGRRFLRI
jgi:hypothetical protein